MYRHRFPITFRARRRQDCARLTTRLSLRLLAFLLALPCAPAVAIDGADDLLRRQQDADAARRERSIDDIHRPGEPALPALPPPSAAPAGPCFTIATLELENVDELMPPAAQQALRADWQGRCRDLDAIRLLQAELTRWLVDAGYVTSRVVLPEQDLSAGTLRLVLVPGRIERYEGALPARTFAAAFPAIDGRLLRLPALEQGVENLNRLPGMNAGIDIVPGTEHGESRVVVGGVEGRHWRLQALLDGRGIEDEADTRGNLTLVTGNLLGLADRITLAGGRKLDDHRLDLSRDASIAIDLPYGFWLFSLAHDRMDYRDDIAGVLTVFRSEGDSRNTRAEIARVLHRRGNVRLALALLAGEGVAENRIDGTVIEVSSYTLRTLGARLEHSTVAGGSQWTTWLTLETGDASGPATRPLGGAPVADTAATRLQLYLRAMRPWRNGQTALTASVSGQYTPDVPFPLQRFSLTADSAVRGFVDSSASAGNALSARLELSHRLQAARWPGALQPYLGLDAGWTPNDASVPAAARAVAMTAGLLWYGDGWQCRFAASDPFGGVSSIGPTAPVIAATLAWSY